MRGERCASATLEIRALDPNGKGCADTSVIESSRSTIISVEWSETAVFNRVCLFSRVVSALVVSISAAIG